MFDGCKYVARIQKVTCPNQKKTSIWEKLLDNDIIEW